MRLIALGLALNASISPVRGRECTANDFAKVLASDGVEHDQFGRDVAISGNTAVIGAVYDDDACACDCEPCDPDCDAECDSGSAYVFRYDGSDWVQVAKLLASDGAAGDYFGVGVGISGNTVVIAAEHDDDIGPDSGSAYVFVQPAGGWDSVESPIYETTKLLPCDGAPGDAFANGPTSVAISGNTAVIKAVYDDDACACDCEPCDPDCDPACDSGSAYVFVEPPGGWGSVPSPMCETNKLLASDGRVGRYFGASVAIGGDTALISAWGDDAGPRTGSVYVFVEPPGGWDSVPSPIYETAKLLASDGAEGVLFGYSLGIDGDTAVIGSPWDEGTGSAYIFVEPPGGWDSVPWPPTPMTETAKLLASDGVQSRRFGHVGIWGDTALVGGASTGSAYVFVEPPGGWDSVPWPVTPMTETAKLLASDGASGGFGQMVAISGDMAVVSAYSDGDNGADAGAAYVFHGLFDCQPNETLDICDIANDASDDCQPNGIPDECEPDCDGDLIPDECEIASCAPENSSCEDCNANGVPNECEVPPICPECPDCNSNGIPDECETDCQPNDIPDDCDIRDGFSQDCNLNGIPDECPGCAADCECDDGLFCSGVETCDVPTGTCVPGLPVDCSSLTHVCNIGECDEDLDTCVAVPANEGASCDDEDVCTDPDICIDGVCRGTLLPVCIPCVVACVCDATHGESHCFEANEAGCLETVDGTLEICVEDSDLDVQVCLGVHSVEIGDPEVDVSIGSAPGHGVALGLYDLNPDGVTFTPESVSLKIREDISGLNPNQRERLDLFWLDEPGAPFDSLGADCCPVGDEALCTVELDHFSTYAFIAAADSDDDGVPDLWPPDEDNCPNHYNPGQADCDSDGMGDVCAIATGASQDNNSNGIPDECFRLPTVPLSPHDARKNRYISIDPDNTESVALQVELTSMQRCSGDPRRACALDADCPGVCDNNNNLQCENDGICGGGTCIPTSPCVQHSSVGAAKWVDEPFESSCLPLDDCSGQWFSNLTDSPIYRVWTEDVIHITDCEVVPVASYDVRATVDSVTFSDPLTIGTIEKPQVHYADCVGPVVADEFTPPDGFVNVTDVQAYLIANQGGASAPHTTWVDLHSSSAPVVPQQILNIGDLQTIKFGFLGQTYVETPGHENPGGCP